MLLRFEFSHACICILKSGLISSPRLLYGPRCIMKKDPHAAKSKAKSKQQIKEERKAEEKRKAEEERKAEEQRKVEQRNLIEENLQIEEDELREDALNAKMIALGDDVTDDMMSEMFETWNEDVRLIMAQTECDRLTAIRALHSCACDLCDALTELGV